MERQSRLGPQVSGLGNLPSGPYKGSVVDKKLVKKRKQEYYKAIGWDKKGIPQSNILKKLGLSEIDKKLNIIRRN